MSVVRETTTWNLKWLTSWKGNHDLKSLGQKERKLLFWPKSQKLHSHNPQCIVKLGKIGAFSDFLAEKARYALLTENLRYQVNHSLSPPLPQRPYPRGGPKRNFISDLVTRVFPSPPPLLPLIGNIMRQALFANERHLPTSSVCWNVTTNWVRSSFLVSKILLDLRNNEVKRTSYLQWNDNKTRLHVRDKFVTVKRFGYWRFEG